MSDGDFIPGDVVSVNVPNYGRREGLVIGTSIDKTGRQVVEIQFDRPGEYYHAWTPLVTRVRRWGAGSPHYHHHHPRTVERVVGYW